MEILELAAERDAEVIACHLALLYTELFGPNAALSESNIRAALDV